jgi:hypothetical protein
MRRTTLATLGLLLCLTVGRAAQAAFECADPGWEGTSELLAIARQTFGSSRVRLVSELDYAELRPGDRIVILHPQTQLDAASLTAFLEAGGRLALLDDFGTSEALLDRFSIRRAMAPLSPKETLNRNVNLPIAFPAAPTTPGGLPADHPLLAGVERVVLNHPTVLTHPTVSPILQIPTTDGNHATVALTAVIGDRSLGRLVVMSDPSAFINLMLRYPGNRALLAGLMRYLKEPNHPSSPQGNLYIFANRFEQRGSFGTDRSLVRQAKSLFEQLPEQIAKPWPRPLLLLLAGLLGLGIVRWVLRYGASTAPSLLPRYVRPTSLVAQAGWPGHAAILTAPTTSTALAVLEYKRGFEEELTRALGLSESRSLPGLLGEVERRRLLAHQGLESLRWLLGELEKAERAVLARRDLHVAPATLRRIHREGLDILARFSQVEPPPRDDRSHAPRPHPGP